MASDRSMNLGLYCLGTLIWKLASFLRVESALLCSPLASDVRKNLTVKNIVYRHLGGSLI